MCLWCADLNRHKVNENDSIEINEENIIFCYDIYDRMLFSMSIYFCPICGQNLKYRFNALIKSPAEQIKHYINHINEKINEAMSQGEYIRSSEYFNKRDGLILALKFMGVNFEKREIDTGRKKRK